MCKNCEYKNSVSTFQALNGILKYLDYGEFQNSEIRRYILWQKELAKQKIHQAWEAKDRNEIAIDIRE